MMVRFVGLIKSHYSKVMVGFAVGLGQGLEVGLG